MESSNSGLQSLPDINEFLHSVGLEQYIPLFHQHDIETKELFSLNDLELKDVGVISFGHRKKLIDSINQYNFEAQKKHLNQEQLESKELTIKILNGYIVLAVLVSLILQFTVTKKGLTGSWFLDGLILAAGLCAFMIPSIIAWWRGNIHKWWILIANIFLGGTGIGWVVCFIFSLSKIDRETAIYFMDKANPKEARHNKE